MKKILVGLFGNKIDPKVIYSDNHSCIKLLVNPFFHDRSKNIDIWYHHLKYYLQRRIMMLEYIPTEDKDANTLKKALSRGKIEFHKGNIGFTDNPFLVERDC